MLRNACARKDRKIFFYISSKRDLAKGSEIGKREREREASAGRELSHLEIISLCFVSTKIVTNDYR